MTAFADLIDLQTAVVELVGRSDIADVFPRLVRLAEADFSRMLRLSEQMAQTTVTITGGAASLPADFQSLIGVYDGAGYEYVAQPPQAIRTHQSRGYYAIIGNSIHAPADEVLTLQYYGSVPTITTGPTGTNWLLQRHPGVYLYGVATEAAKYARDAELALALARVLDNEYRKANEAESAKRYSRARVRVQGVTP
jgi:uncharacterized radical SAM superfamily Fe-S cluster-containing enzyme